MYILSSSFAESSTNNCRGERHFPCEGVRVSSRRYVCRPWALPSSRNCATTSGLPCPGAGGRRRRQGQGKKRESLQVRAIRTVRSQDPVMMEPDCWVDLWAAIGRVGCEVLPGAAERASSPALKDFIGALPTLRIVSLPRMLGPWNSRSRGGDGPTSEMLLGVSRAVGPVQCISPMGRQDMNPH